MMTHFLETIEMMGVTESGIQIVKQKITIPKKQMECIGNTIVIPVSDNVLHDDSSNIYIIGKARNWHLK